MKLFLLLFFSLIFITEVKAAGIGIAPGELNFNVERGRTQQKELTIYNLENQEIEFEVSSSADFLEFYHNGILEASGVDKIIVEAATGNLKEGSYNELIYITSSNGASGVKLDLGVAVKANVLVYSTEKANTFFGLIISISIVFVGLLIYFLATKREIIARLVKEQY